MQGKSLNGKSLVVMFSRKKIEMAPKKRRATKKQKGKHFHIV